MKKITTLIGICIILFSTCATGGQDANSQIVPLDEAIRAAAEYLENTLNWGNLFTEEEISIAKKRLLEYKYLKEEK